MSDALPLSLQSKLGSICVHAEELLSPKGHDFDRHALEGLLADPEVTAWLKTLGPLLRGSDERLASHHRHRVRRPSRF